MRLTSVFGTYLLILSVLFPADRLRAEPVDAKEVQQTIDSTVGFLLRAQLPDGSWPEYDKNYPAGVSSLVTLALLNTGMEPDRREMAKALSYLSRRQLKRTYTVSLQTMALCVANPNKYADVIAGNAQWLIDQQLGNGSWDYGEASGGNGDPSNSQFALLALHEAQRAGVKIPNREWKKVFTKARDYWERIQNRDGSFSYDNGSRGRGSMTCAGIASLIIAGTQLNDGEASVTNTIHCCGDPSPGENRIQLGMDWLGRNFSVTSNPGYSSYHLYYIYALERVGRLSGQRLIGRHDWYRQGSEHIVRVLHDKTRGRIVSRGGSTLGNDYSETAFALLFLAKGKRQTVVSRLNYPALDNDWNLHSSAIQHLTAHTEQAWKRDLSWQNLRLNNATTVRDLLETPVLFISGSDAPRFSARHKRLLQEYVRQGGFIFAEACHGDGCQGKDFENFFRDLVVELFDQPLEKLSPDHPIWYAESRISPEDLPPDTWLYGVQTCCRLGVVYAPFSLSCRWALHQPYGIQPDYPEPVQKQLETSTKLGINVLAYATGKELKEKLDTATVLEEVRNMAPSDRGIFVLPKLRHNAGADDAPRAIPNLIQWLDKSNPFQLSSEKRLIGISEAELALHPVVFMHGRGTLKLSEKQRSILRRFLENGGFIFADAICADEAFAESFRQEMRLVVGDTLTPVPASHPLLTDAFYGFDIRQVRVIDPKDAGEGIVAATSRRLPQLEVAKVNQREAIVFSPLDLSCALESRHSLQCRGYVREDAARIGINVILFALQNY